MTTAEAHTRSMLRAAVFGDGDVPRWFDERLADHEAAIRAEYEDGEEHCCNDPEHMSAEYLARIDRAALDATEAER